MNFIDSITDHYMRPVDTRHVHAMTMKAVLAADGRPVPEPIFTRSTTAHVYGNCVCGKEIEYNFIAQCKQTGKAFIVGSECINTVCSANKFTLVLDCSVCNETIATVKNWDDEEEAALATAPRKRCKDCSLMFRRRNNRVCVGKYSEYQYKEMLSERPYVDWLRAQPELGGHLAALLAWIDFVKDHPKVLEDDPESAELRAELDRSPEPEIRAGAGGPAKASAKPSLITFGKHRGRTYDDMLAKESGYCAWVRSQVAASAPLKEFQEWLKAR